MLNQTVLTGNLGQDPEIFFSSDGDPIANFSLINQSLFKFIQLNQKILSLSPILSC
jgi:single-stranded DNA-binding protein